MSEKLSGKEWKRRQAEAWANMFGRLGLPASPSGLGVTVSPDEALLLIEQLQEAAHLIRASLALHISPVWAQTPEGAQSEAKLTQSLQILDHLTGKERFAMK